VSAAARHLARLAAYDRWANGEAARSVHAASAAPERAVAVLGHLVGAQWLWLKRLGEPAPEMAVWPALALDDCARGLDAVGAVWVRLLGDASDARLAETIRYTNSKGEPWTSVVEDVVVHVQLHSAHHRGQIALELRRAGAAPAYTDYIHAVRQGLLG
jgi:uncharacterized damage-inducible protein DinB